MLDMRPGNVVVESGTGSGSFSHSIARIIGPLGHLHTFEFHPVRAERAREEFKAHGLSDVITVHHQDVCKNGFGLTDVADCVFLDLPAPWEALAHAKQALRKDRSTRVCCFSPCAEQVQKTCDMLRQLAFCEIKMYEVLIRDHLVTKLDLKQDFLPIELQNNSLRPNAGNPSSILISRPMEGMRGHTSYLTFATLLPAHTMPEA
jgi:tRNA (adenine57-N1/adenine58-N1)-methyltransferase